MKNLAKPGRVLYRAWIKVVETLVSKKFMVFITSTTLLVLAYIPPEIWVPVALSVVGSELALDYKGAPRRTYGEPEDHAYTSPNPIAPSYEQPIQEP